VVTRIKGCCSDTSDSRSRKCTAKILGKNEILWISSKSLDKSSCAIKINKKKLCAARTSTKPLVLSKVNVVFFFIKRDIKPRNKKGG
jgi:hypothetical protein